MALGVFAGPLVYALVPLHMFIIQKKGEWLWLLLGFWLILTLSDSRKIMFSFAETIKPLVLITLAFLLYTNTNHPKSSFYKPFIPFFIIAFYSLVESPRLTTGFQKTLSYLIFLATIPGIVNLLINDQRDRFLTHLVYLGTILLGVGLVLRVINPGFVLFAGERYSGLLGNPNAIGIYGFVFLALFTTIKHYHQQLFSNKETIIIYSIIALSQIFAGSRGGIFACLIFMLAWVLFRKSAVMAFISMTVIFFSSTLVMNNFVEVVTYLGLTDYFRLETLETGSGRIYVTELAWQYIHQNFWFSKGFAYNEHILSIHQLSLASKGHVGNFHNSWLTIWIDTGLIGLLLFSIGWITNFIKASRYSNMIWALFFGMLISVSVESWLIASLNPFTIVAVIILTMMSNPNFYAYNENEFIEQD